MTKKPPASSRFRAPRRLRPRVRFSRKWIKGILSVLVLAVVAVGAHQVWRLGVIQDFFARPPKMEDLLAGSNRLDDALRRSLDDLGASPIFVVQHDSVVVEENRRWRFRRVTVQVSDQVSLMHCNLAITRGIEAAGGEILSAEQGRGGESLVVEIGLQGLPTHLVRLSSEQSIQPTLGRLGIIIDDFGAISGPVAEAFINLPINLTMAVIPGHTTSQHLASQAVAAGHEVLVHLPMQPKDGEVGEENAILVDLSEDEIRRRVRWALSEIPQAVGVNNHMGSLATENEKVMRAVLQEVKAAGKFFVDSRTSSQSVVAEAGRKVDLCCDRSDGFLDYQDEGAEIEKSLEELTDHALQQGTAIGIGHVRANTLEVLREMFPALENRGIRFSHVSRILEARR